MHLKSYLSDSRQDLGCVSRIGKGISPKFSSPGFTEVGDPFEVGAGEKESCSSGLRKLQARVGCSRICDQRQLAMWAGARDSTQARGANAVRLLLAQCVWQTWFNQNQPRVLLCPSLPACVASSLYTQKLVSSISPTVIDAVKNKYDRGLP